jgi:1-deoxy-D-xylulose-5-phosphate reductoisomerase
VRRVSILGCTGSVGSQTLEVIRAHPGAFEVVALSANSRSSELAAAVTEFKPELAALGDPTCGTAELRQACRDAGTELMLGAEGVESVGAHADGEVVLAAIVGAAGLPGTAAAVERGAVVALANKESLVVAGEALTRRAAETGATLLPVDSEHAAIHQCLRAGRDDEVRRLVLTASGGPFRTRPAETFDAITREEALDHPTWTMGAKITIDSATIMNKGLEIIEASWLFGTSEERIDVVLHPQSIVHSLVEFRDGSVIAQLSLPDMRDPIRYCLTWPERWEAPVAPLDLASVSPLTFEEPDEVKFPCLRLAREALAAGGGAPAVLNAANEVAVAAFLDGRLSFTGIARLVEETLASVGSPPASSLAEALEADRLGRETAERALTDRKDERGA